MCVCLSLSLSVSLLRLCERLPSGSWVCRGGRHDGVSLCVSALVGAWVDDYRFVKTPATLLSPSRVPGCPAATVYAFSRERHRKRRERLGFFSD